jgi:GRAM domain
MSRTKSVVGGISFRQAPLSADETVILEADAHYREPRTMWRYGRLFLTNHRLIFCPWRLSLSFVFRKPFSILFSEIAEAHAIEGVKSFLDRPGIEVRTGDTIHRFSFGIYGVGRPAVWANALEERLRSEGQNH